LIGVAVAVTAALSLTVMATGSIATPDRAPDTLMVERLSRSAPPDRIQATTSISDAAWLAAGLLTTAIDVKIDLPLIQR
jgi:hypothetical protein